MSNLAAGIQVACRPLQHHVLSSHHHTDFPTPSEIHYRSVPDLLLQCTGLLDECHHQNTRELYVHGENPPKIMYTPVK